MVPDPALFANHGAPSALLTSIDCLLPLPQKVSDAVFHFGVFYIVAGTRFDAGRILLALERACEVRWAIVNGSGSFGKKNPTRPSWGHGSLNLTRPPTSSHGTREAMEPLAVELCTQSPTISAVRSVELERCQHDMAVLNNRLTHAYAERDRAVEEVKVLTEQGDGAHASVEEVRKLVASAKIELAARFAEVSAQSNELSEARRELAATHTELARTHDVLQKL